MTSSDITGFLQMNARFEEIESQASERISEMETQLMQTTKEMELLKVKHAEFDRVSLCQKALQLSRSTTHLEPCSSGSNQKKETRANCYKSQDSQSVIEYTSKLLYWSTSHLIV